MIKTITLLFMSLLLIGSVTAMSLSTGDSSSGAANDYQPSAQSGAGGSSAKKHCLTHWSTFDNGKTWSKRDVFTIKNGKIKIVDGNKCKMNQPLAQARQMYANGFKPLYDRVGPIEQSLVWTENGRALRP